MAGGLVEYAREAPEEVALADHNVSFTRRELNDRVNRCISLLRELGVRLGEGVGILAMNSADYVIVALGAGLSGLSLVPVNWHFTADEAAYILAHARTKVLFVEEGEFERTTEQAAKLAGCERIIRLGKELDSLLARSSNDEPGPDTRYGSPVFFTSGTTGRPKATQLSQMPQGVPVQTALEKIRLNAHVGGVSAETVHLVQGPLYHAGPIGNAINSILVGGRVHILRRFDPEDVLRNIETHKVTHTMMVPTMFVRLLRLPEETRKLFDVSSLQLVTHLAAPIPIEVKRQMIDWWGPILVDAYGCSEIGVITKITSEEWLKKPGSVGKPIPSFTLEIVGEDNEYLAPGQIGMIYATSLTEVDLSYIEDPEKTAAAHRNEKQFTIGDMGWLDEDGYLFLADRRVDMINSGGVNIYPAEIEAVLIQHPAVEDVCVVGAPNPGWGQEVRAAIQLRSGHHASSSLEHEIQNWLSQRIAKYKVPKSIEFLDKMPRYPNGKLHRREIRERYWAKENSSLAQARIA